MRRTNAAFLIPTYEYSKRINRDKIVMDMLGKAKFVWENTFGEVLVVVRIGMKKQQDGVLGVRWNRGLKQM